MRTLAAVILAALIGGCGGGGGESVVGAWEYNGSTVAEGLWFHADGRQSPTPPTTIAISYGCNENGTWVPAQ